LTQQATVVGKTSVTQTFIRQIDMVSLGVIPFAYTSNLRFSTLLVLLFFKSKLFKQKYNELFSFHIYLLFLWLWCSGSGFCFETRNPMINSFLFRTKFDWHYNDNKELDLHLGWKKHTGVSIASRTVDKQHCCFHEKWLDFYFWIFHNYVGKYQNLNINVSLNYKFIVVGQLKLLLDSRFLLFKVTFNVQHAQTGCISKPRT